MTKKTAKKRGDTRAEKYTYVDVRFAANPQTIYTYRVRKGAKVHLGQSLVVYNERGSSVVFVVDVNSGRHREFAGELKEISHKVVKL